MRIGPHACYSINAIAENAEAAIRSFSRQVPRTLGTPRLSFEDYRDGALKQVVYTDGESMTQGGLRNLLSRSYEPVEEPSILRILGET